MERTRKYWAHTANARGEWHDLCQHLYSVAELAQQFGKSFGAGDWAYAAGLWHDLGKFSQAFQDYLRSASTDTAHAAELRGSVDHTSAGSQHAAAAYEVIGHLLAYGIAGHHAGLLDAISNGACLDRRLKKSIEPWQHGLELLADPKRPELPAFLREKLTRRSVDPGGVAFSFAFFARMVFSCLVDADSLDTEAFLDPEKTNERPSWRPDIAMRMLEALSSYVEKLESDRSSVNIVRQEVRRACLSAALEKQGLFSLTVPTGGGKTLSSLAFALTHCIHHGLRRIVYIVPFTTIIEQNAEVFRRVFAPLAAEGFADPVLEHHSALDAEKETLASRLAAENWDAPLIVTTSVQFYESLFASRTTPCRKLHNLAKSVIVLDEVQKIPVEYLTACLATLQELASGYGSTIVLCTATQPAIQQRSDFRIGLTGVREIIPEPRRIYIALKRVEVRDLGEVRDSELVEHLVQQPQVLCVVNTRAHARQLFALLAQKEGLIHLSAAMCPCHRSEVLERVRARLSAGELCRVVATQLVEAGVDLDFPVVYRSLAGLDSIAQAAGRCNRNGRAPRGTTYLFRSEHGKSESFLRDTTNAAAQLLGDGAATQAMYQDILSLEAVEHYFQLYYWSQQERWDAHGILEQFKLEDRRDLPFVFGFRTVAESFHLIRDAGRPVIVPWKEQGRRLCDELRRPWRVADRSLLRALQRYTVQMPARVWQDAMGLSVELVHDEFPVLVSPDLYYDENVGLVLEEKVLDADRMIV